MSEEKQIPAVLTEEQKIGQQLSKMREAGSEKLVEATSEYLSLQVGDDKIFAVRGLTTMQKSGKPIPCVQLVTETGEAVINGDSVLVSTVTRLIETDKTKTPFAIWVNVTGKKESTMGEYLTMSIKVVPAPVK